jgi:hypothetical protein
MGLALAFLIGKSRSLKIKAEISLLCGSVSLGDQKSMGSVLDMHICSNTATTIIGGRAMCDMHFDLYVDELVGMVRE